MMEYNYTYNVATKEVDKLKILGFSWCKSLTDKAIESIIQHTSHIELLDVRGNEKISSHALSKVFNSLNSFKAVHLKRCAGVTTEVLIALSKSKENLQKLNLRGCYKNNNISNDAMIYLFKSCYNIEYLDIAWHDYLEDQAIIALADYCKNLRNIDLSGCELINDEAIIYLAKNCMNLKKIIFFNNHKISRDTVGYLQTKAIEVKQY